ncbi:hypothetical protein C8R47DRAFT_56628 [Mycena vitilis]|nr:hypothetical protein C8R47DRAFT_56628 [Mycena vitilis]
MRRRRDRCTLLILLSLSTSRATPPRIGRATPRRRRHPPAARWARLCTTSYPAVVDPPDDLHDTPGPGPTPPPRTPAHPGSRSTYRASMVQTPPGSENPPIKGDSPAFTISWRCFAHRADFKAQASVQGRGAADGQRACNGLERGWRARVPASPVNAGGQGQGAQQWCSRNFDGLQSSAGGSAAGFGQGRRGADGPVSTRTVSAPHIFLPFFSHTRTNNYDTFPPI